MENKFVLELVEEEINKGRVVDLKISGDSMLPCLKDGDTVFIEKCDLSDLKKGRIIVFWYGEDLCIHRYIRSEISRSGQLSLITKGDNVACQDEFPVFPDQLFGKVVRFERTGRDLDLETPLSRTVNCVIGVISSAQADSLITLRFLRENLLGDRFPRLGLFLREKIMAMFFIAMSCFALIQRSFLLRGREDRPQARKITINRVTEIRMHTCRKENIDLFNMILKRDRDGIESVLRTKVPGQDNFADFVRNHGVGGSIYHCIKDPEVKDLFPDETFRKYRSLFIDQWIANEDLLRQTAYLNNMIRNHGREVIFLKGPFFLQRYYGDIALRSVSDIDILVKKNEVDDIGNILEEKGVELRSRVFLGRTLTKYFTHHFECSYKSTPLDVHWVLANHVSFNIDYNRIWAEKRDHEFGGATYNVLSDEYVLVSKTLELITDIQIGKVTLKSFLDLYMVLKRIGGEINWSTFFNARKKEKTFIVALNVLDLVLDVLGCCSDFPDLSGYIEDNGRYIRGRKEEFRYRLFDRSKFALRNKIWTFGSYETSLFASFCWWAVSLPFRMSMHPDCWKEQLKTQSIVT